MNSKKIPLAHEELQDKKEKERKTKNTHYPPRNQGFFYLKKKSKPLKRSDFEKTVQLFMGVKGHAYAQGILIASYVEMNGVPGGGDESDEKEGSEGRY
jgi:hypothetical protein